MISRHVTMLSAVFCVVALLSCGKVTQEASSTEEIKAFDATYWVAVVTRNAAAVSRNVFTTANTTIYSQILGFKKDGIRQELSWGKAILLEEKRSYASAAFKKDGLKVDKPVLYATKLTFDPVNYRWRAESAKVKVRYLNYLVSVYSDKDKYQLKIISERQVSQNRTIDFGEMSLYDTFLSLLYLTSLEESESLLTDPDLFTQLIRFYDIRFFRSLGYALPTNVTKQFDPNNPVFMFDRPLERNLLKIFRLTQGQEGTKEAVQFVQDLKEDQLSRPLQALLLKKLSTYGR